MRIDQVYNWIEEMKPKIILEIGTWDGENAKRMMSYGAEKYIGFDLFEDGDEMLDELENNVKARTNLDQVAEKLKDFDCELIKGNTRETLPAYIEGKKPFVDMALIDGGHSKGTIQNDLLKIIPIMKPTGAIFMDDYYFDCPISNVGAQEVLKNCNMAFTVLPKAGRAKAGKGFYMVKMVRIDMRDVPRPNVWDVSADQSWTFAA